MRERFFSIFTVLSKPAVAIVGALLIAALLVGAALQTSTVVPRGQYTAAVVAPIVAIGGGNSDLSFQVSGQVISIPVSIGVEVKAGDVLVALDRSSLLATRAGAVANQEAATARLAALQAGTRPEQLAIDQTAVAQAKNALTSALQAAYANADDAVHGKADQVFTNLSNSSAQLTILAPTATDAIVGRIDAERVALEPLLASWRTALASATGDTESLAIVSETNLRSVASFLDDIMTALSEAQKNSSISTAAFVGYQTSMNAGRLNVSAALSALITADTAYKATVGALTLAQAGATANDIAAQKAVVDGTQAVLRGIDVSLQESTLVAPLAGTITTLNARLGQTVAPGQILVSVESSGGSKQDALVIPTSSVIENGSHAFVFVMEGSGAPTKAPVTTGLVSADGMTEITSGLTAGQEVLTFGTGTK